MDKQEATLLLRDHLTAIVVVATATSLHCWVNRRSLSCKALRGRPIRLKLRFTGISSQAAPFVFSARSTTADGARLSLSRKTSSWPQTELSFDDSCLADPSRAPTDDEHPYRQ